MSGVDSYARGKVGPADECLRFDEAADDGKVTQERDPAGLAGARQGACSIFGTTSLEFVITGGINREIA